MKDLAIYIHWPFCQSKCPYCDFNSHVAQTIDQSAWRRSYQLALTHYAQLMPDRRITSIFFGGGTPSLMEAETVEVILATIAKYWPLSEGIEITLEANPTSVEALKFAAFRTAGVNRLSLGVQSFDEKALEFLGRKHSADQARRALELAGQHFQRYSFDLIYARHGQTLESWDIELREALKLTHDHISLYQLTIEPNTQFYTLANRGEKLIAPDEEAASMYELTQTILRDVGMPAYEISNYAKPGSESRHNLTYWHYNDYIGIGPGAHGRYELNGQRFATEDHRSPEVWLKHVAENYQGLRVNDALDFVTCEREALMMGLRLIDGISFKNWRDKFGTSLENYLPADKIHKLQDENYLTQNPKALQATDAGLQRLNAVLSYLMN